ncbi:MAG: O-antigen ligase family protein [Ruminococcus sp.]|nr:O-antigen ligase family protein [Ruminococcus sp.]
MIWLWITLAVVLSAIPLIKKKIDIANYIWLLIPIESYGISLAGTAIRPYMIFACALPIILYAKNKGKDFDLSLKKSHLLAGVICILILTHSVFLSEGYEAIKGALFLVGVYVCAQLATSCTNVNSCNTLCDVFIACSFGYAIVYIIAYICVKNGIIIDGFLAADRTDDGIIKIMGNMFNGQYIRSIRLRGFSYDPNVMFIQFFFSMPACISKFFKKFNLYHVITLILSIVCIILSSSRMGLICCALTLVITICVFLLQLDSVKKKVISLTTVLTSSAVVAAVFITPWGQSVLSGVLSNYTNRSSLSDEYGRFTIWAESLRIYWEKSPLFGVGLTQMSKYTSVGFMIHNTWLQLLCECGILVGGLAIVYFFSVLVYGWIKLRTKPKNNSISDAYLCILIGYTVTLISLISVDNYACSYLWFGALMLTQLAPYTSTVNKTKLSDETLSK